MVMTQCTNTLPPTGSNPVHAPTASWVAAQPASDEFPRPRHFSPSRPEERYGPPHHQYSQYGGYAHRTLEAKAAQQRLDYELEQPYQHDVNLYEYSYTESSTHGDQQASKYSRTSPRRPAAGDAASLPRRYGGRLWWTGVPLPVVGAHGDPYMSRQLGPEGQQGRGGGEARRGAPTRRLLHNESLAGGARVQKSLQHSGLFGQDFSDVRAAPTTTPAPTHPRDKQPSGLESFLRLMTEDEPTEAAPGEVVPEPPGNEKSHSRSNRGRGWGERQADSREGQPAPAPVTATAVLGSVMLLIILVVVRTHADNCVMLRYSLRTYQHK